MNFCIIIGAVITRGLVMKVLLSKNFLKWESANKNDRMADAIDKFLLRVFRADDAAQVLPTPKSVGKDLRKMPGSVNKYDLNYHYRAYGKYVNFNGELSFCLATVGDKGSGMQINDILTALSIFDDVDAAEWKEWEPSQEQLAADLTVNATPTDHDCDDDKPMPAAAEAKPAKKKGKPLDENGLTVAERKKKQQEEQKKLREETKKTKKTKTVAATPIVDAQPPVDTPATVETAADNVPVNDDISDDEIRVLGGEQPKFQDIMTVQYRLKVIERQMAIEKLKIQIAQYEIALEELEIEKLRLLQMQKMKEMQK